MVTPPLALGFLLYSGYYSFRVVCSPTFKLQRSLSRHFYLKQIVLFKQKLICNYKRKLTTNKIVHGDPSDKSGVGRGESLMMSCEYRRELKSTSVIIAAWNEMEVTRVRNAIGKREVTMNLNT